jgi:cobalt-precorrin 5A hydrolase/precorrin-3B C17-methyltransferase
VREPDRGGGPVLCLSVTERGRALARRLPFESLHGDPRRALEEHWGEAAGFVCFLAVGAAVRLVAPLLGGKERDPAVVCVDDAGRFAVAVLGGHARDANGLAREVAALLGATPVVTTATDATGIPALDRLRGVTARGDVAGVTAALLAGERPEVVTEVAWPTPPALETLVGPPTPGPTAARPVDAPATARIVLTDRLVDPAPGVVALHPPSLVAGIGLSSDCGRGELAELLGESLAAARLARESLGLVATIDRRADHPALAALGLPVRVLGAAELAAVAVPNPSPRVARAVGTPSVAEAAALAAAGPGGSLVLPKRRSARATVALARRGRPLGHLALVGLGPGGPEHRTSAAVRALREADLVVGYRPYVAAARDLLEPSQEVLESPIGAERARAEAAVRAALAGRRVALVSSGDAGVYAMASLALEVLDELVRPAGGPSGGPDGLPLGLEVVPGVTAALAAAARLGAPLGHDHAYLSLSDLLTPWPVILSRLEHCAAADLVLALYNPRSAGRPDRLAEALEVLRRHRDPATPVGVVTDACRPGEQVVLTRLSEVDPELVGMTTCVIVGCSTTTVRAGRMVTPRGYPPHARLPRPAVGGSGSSASAP